MPSQSRTEREKAQAILPREGGSAAWVGWVGGDGDAGSQCPYYLPTHLLLSSPVGGHGVVVEVGGRGVQRVAVIARVDGPLAPEGWRSANIHPSIHGTANSASR